MYEFDTLKDAIIKYNPKADISVVKKAYDFAKEAHTGQVRESGEEYFSHPFNTAMILTRLRVQSATINAALLHDVIEESKVSLKKLKAEFGPEITALVEGVTKIDKIHFESKADYTAENLRKVLLATAKDIRIMLIKLADRLHNMRTLKPLRDDKQKRIATETLNIYAPIAHKLGVWNIKGELEDLSLRYMEPEIYQALRDRIHEKREEREEKTTQIINVIKEKLKESGIRADVYGRAKYFYSIYKKMKRKNVDFSEIYDLIAIRIITDTIPDCYTALGIIHDLWKPIPKKFKDYISTPKANGYQSLHTAVVGSHGKILEVQIRTEEMHQVAEDGIAAHWRYKGTERDKKFDRKISWIKQILDWRRTAEDAQDFIETLKIDLFEKEIIVFTPKGDPISLPEGASPVDFAYEIHSTVGNTCSKSLVNEKLVPLDTMLQPGDVIEIVTQKNAKPSRQWLKFVKTSKARSKIRSILKIEREPEKKHEREAVKENQKKHIEIIGKQAPIKISKCCDARLNDDIVGYYTKDGKITVHRKDCSNVSTLEANKLANVMWKQYNTCHSITIRVLVKDKVGMIADVLNSVARLKLNIEKLMTETAKHEKFVMTIRVSVPEPDKYEQMLKTMKSMPDVISVEEIK